MRLEAALDFRREQGATERMAIYHDLGPSLGRNSEIKMVGCDARNLGNAGTVSCNKQEGPVGEAISYKDDYQQAYIDGFPMIAAYKAMYQFAIDKTNSQYKTPFNHIWNDSNLLAQGHGHRYSERRHAIFPARNGPAWGTAGHLGSED